MALVLGPDGAVVPTQSSPYVALRETLSLVQRQIEDLRWDSVSTDPDSITDAPYGERVESIKLARRAVGRNPLVKVAINLLQHYTLGQGVSVKAQNRALVAKIVDEMMESAANKAVIMSHPSQTEFLEALYTDGDFFFILFPDFDKGTLEIGTIDATLVEDVIGAKDNAKLPRWYKVRKPRKEYNYAQGSWESSAGDEFFYYRHFENEDPALPDDQRVGEGGDPTPAGMAGKLKPGLMMQVSIDKRGKFGRSQLLTALDWLRAHREFMEDRATINKAAAAVAWKKKRKGPASDIAAEALKLQSTLATNTSRYEQNPPKAAGSTIVENENSTLEWVKTETGGSAADYDERKLRMMSGAGLGGIPNHYFGDEGNANLATATAMELPLLKMYEAWQQILADAMGSIFRYGLGVAHKAGRIGENDMSARYTDRQTTPQGVMEQPDPVVPPGAATAGPVAAREAFAADGTPLKLPYAPAPEGHVRMIPRPDALKPLETPTNQEDPTKAVSWYIDIDFPPIVQKEVDKYMTALTSLQAMLPSETIEGRKLIAELALAAFGVNDIDEQMSRLFPPDMVAVMVPPPAPQPGMPGSPFPSVPKQVPAEPVKAKESEPVESIAALRRRRLIRAAEAAEEAATALTEVG